MTKPPRAIFGTVEEHGVHSVVLELKKAGFSFSDISILIPQGRTPKDTGLFSDAAQGAIQGSLIGAMLAEFLAATSLLIPGVGLFLAAGPVVTALAGAAAGGTLAALTAATGTVASVIGIPRSAVKRFEKELRQGRALVMVHCETESMKARARAVFERTDVRAAA